MQTIKIMKNFNIEMYNEKMAELDNAIKIINDYIYDCQIWYPDEYLTSPNILELLTHPTDLFDKDFSFVLLSIAAYKGNFWEQSESSESSESWINPTRHVIDSVENEIALCEIIPYIKESYGKLLKIRIKEDYNYDFSNVVVKTKKAERLIMEQCIEWEDDYMNEEV